MGVLAWFGVCTALSSERALVWPFLVPGASLGERLLGAGLHGLGFAALFSAPLAVYLAVEDMRDARDEGPSWLLVPVTSGARWAALSVTFFPVGALNLGLLVTIRLSAGVAVEVLGLLLLAWVVLSAAFVGFVYVRRPARGEGAETSDGPKGQRTT